MPIHEFPDPRDADENGIVAVGGDLHPKSLLLAYSQGIFPWPVDDFPLIPWFCPEERGILEFARLHIPKSLAKLQRKNPYRFSIDGDFDAVIEACARVPRKSAAGGRESTWITPEMLAAYKRFHREGYAHSVEVWARAGESEREKEKLVGGLYGVEVNGIFSGESMFSLEPNASKLALLRLIDHLRAFGVHWIDIQMVTPHMERLGARAVSRDGFLRMLKKTQRRRLRLF
ncbi:MAG: leucyl/phenylalanyl-tRNA--protein transferase [Deltaproteobacteria bacterium]|nr:leucyl/phenylalanyl-tRNA--protein transferase [Deltaproteobacteria bacterium]